MTVRSLPNITVFLFQVRSAPRPRTFPLRLVLLVLMTSLVVSGNPMPASAGTSPLPAEHRETEDQRDSRVWNMLRQESRSFISAILPDKMAARTHDVLWSAPLHERAAREERIPRYTVVAMAGPPMLQSHDTELLDAALAPAVAGEFGRKASGSSSGGRLPVMVTGDDAGNRRPEMAHEAELMPNALKTDEERGGDVEGAQAMAGHFGQRESSRPGGGVLIGDEAAPSAAEAGHVPAGAATPGDIVSGFSSFPQTERVPYLQSVRDYQAEMKEEAEQTALPTSPSVAEDELSPPAFEEFPFDSLKMDSSAGGSPEQAEFIEQDTGDANSNEQLPFDTSNFPNFPKFSFPRGSDQDGTGRPDNVPSIGHGAMNTFKQGEAHSQRPAGPETTRFPMFPGDQEPANGDNMDSDTEDMGTSMESMKSDQQRDVFQEMMKKQPETTAPLVTEEMTSDGMGSAAHDSGAETINNDGEFTSHAGGLPLAPVIGDRNPDTPSAGPANNQFENFREGGAYPDLSLIGFPSFPDIPCESRKWGFPLQTNSKTQTIRHPSVEATDVNRTESAPASVRPH